VNLLFDSHWDDERRRSAVYGGDVFVFSPSSPALALIARARELLEAAFAPYHPTEAQYHVPVADFAAVLADVKPAFIHDPLCKQLIPQLIEALGADPAQIYFDVPRMRSSSVCPRGSAAAGTRSSGRVARAVRPDARAGRPACGDAPTPRLPRRPWGAA